MRIHQTHASDGILLYIASFGVITFAWLVALGWAAWNMVNP